MIINVTGTTSFMRASARSRYSNWPLQTKYVPVGSCTCLVHRLLRVGNVAAEITVADVDEDVGRELGVFGADASRALRELDIGDFAQRHRAAIWKRHQNVLCDGLRIGTQIARIADSDGVAFPALHRGGDWLGTERHRHHVLHVGDHQAVARQLVAVGKDFQIVATDDALGVGAGRAWDGFEDAFDLAERPSPWR